MTTSSSTVPADNQQRDRISGDLDNTLLVEAGAGTGKTESLVSRIVALIDSGTCTIDRIAAITFTDAAASELKERVRMGLEARTSITGVDDQSRGRCSLALGSIESASIQTLHSFAGSLLRQRPLEAGLPPGFETWSDIESGMDFENRWQEWLDQSLDSKDIGQWFALGITLGFRMDALKGVAQIFHANYDLLYSPLGSAKTMVDRTAGVEISNSVADIERLLDLSNLGAGDLLYQHAARVVALGRRLSRIGPSSDAALGILHRWGKLSLNRGRQSDWKNDPSTGGNGCTVMKALLAELENHRVTEIEECGRQVLSSLAEAIRQFVLVYATDRRRNGTAGFHDLLVWARDMLRDNDSARESFQNRFSRVLIDELQDTDPIQTEIACYLASVPVPGPVDDWTQLTIEPGKLFVVGDPKQSIYRFRRADIESMRAIRSLLAVESTDLIQNFRSSPEIINWVNRLFEQWMGTNPQSPLQAEYKPLSARIQSSAPGKSSVSWIGGSRDARAVEVRREESFCLSSLIKKIRDEGWSVRDSHTGEHRPARFHDICVLIPSRTGLRALEHSLEEIDVPFRVESQSLILSTQDVRDLLSCLRAVDSPGDQVATVAALRSSAFGCSDTELLDFVYQGGRFDYLEEPTCSGPVAEALDALRTYHLVRDWLPPEELIEKLIRDRRLVESSFGLARPRERWRRMRFVVDRARAFSEVGGASLRSFIDWMELQAEQGARIVETPVPESDEDAVRIMTIHAAKGLEFPVVLLSGLGAGVSNQTQSVLFDRSSKSVEVGFGSQSAAVRFRTAGFDDAVARDQAASDSESVRLAYVAATRARDHLVVSLFHPDRNTSCTAATIAGYMAGEDTLWTEVPLSGLSSPDRGNKLPETSTYKGDTEADRNSWIDQRQKAFAIASRPTSIAATSLGAIQKDEADGGQIPYRKGRGSSNLGRAVHSVLQTVDLETGDGLEDISKAQAKAEGVGDRWKDVADLVRNAIESNIVKEAVTSGRYYRELFVSAPVNGVLLEGFIDLLFEDSEGMTIIDYKTDNVDSETDIDTATQRYGAQIGGYALALQGATGKPVTRAILLFLRSNREVLMPEIESLIADARRKMTQINVAV